MILNPSDAKLPLLDFWENPLIPAQLCKWDEYNVTIASWSSLSAWCLSLSGFTEGKCYTLPYKDFLHNHVLPTLWQRFEEECDGQVFINISYPIVFHVLTDRTLACWLLFRCSIHNTAHCVLKTKLSFHLTLCYRRCTNTMMKSRDLAKLFFIK